MATHLARQRLEAGKGELSRAAAADPGCRALARTRCAAGAKSAGQDSVVQGPFWDRWQRAGGCGRESCGSEPPSTCRVVVAIGLLRPCLGSKTGLRDSGLQKLAGRNQNIGCSTISKSSLMIFLEPLRRSIDAFTGGRLRILELPAIKVSRTGQTLSRNGFLHIIRLLRKVASSTERVKPVPRLM